MGIEETSPVLLSRPSLPPKPQVPPKPEPRGTRWRRATDVIRREIAGEEGDQSRIAQKARHKSLPSLPNEESMCLSVAKDDSPFPQPDGLLSFLERVKPLPLPKPRLQRKPLRQDSKPFPADKERASSTGRSDSVEGRLRNMRCGSEGDSPASGLGCAPSCTCTCHSSCHLKAGEGPFKTEPHLRAPPSSLPGLCLHARGLKDDLHLDCCCITCPRSPKKSERVLPKIPPLARPLPKEPDVISIQDRKEEPAVPEGVYLEIDLSPSEVFDHCTTAVMCNGHLGTPAFPDAGVRVVLQSAKVWFSKVPKPLPPIPATLQPAPKKQSTNKERDRRTCNAPLQSVVAELQEKFPSDCKEIKSREKPDVKKRENGQKFSLLCKRSPTHAMALSQKKNLPLAELVSFSFKSKESAQELQEAVATTQSPTMPASLVRETWEDVTVKENLNVSDLSSPATPLGVQALEEDDDMVLHLTDDSDDLRSTPLGVMSRVSIRGCHRSLKPFWQERTIVMDSGVLTQLSKQKLLLHESMYEVVTTEQSYLVSLNVAVDLFMESSALNQVLAPRDRKSLFSSLGKIREISQNFLDAMQSELEASLFYDVCKVIRLHASEHFGAYVDYIRNMPYQEQTLHNLGKEDPQIKEILRQLQEDPRCHRLPLKSFLVLPFQRITRLKILVQTILKRTDPGSDGQASAQQALKEISKVVEACDHEVGRMKQMEELVHIANKTEFEYKALPLVSSSRWLVKQGELAHLTDKENIFGKRKVFPVYLFLFNDLLLVTVKKGLDRFVVQDHVHRSLIEINDEVEDEEVEGELENTFLLALLKDHKGKTSQRVLRAPSQTEKASWVEALRPQQSGKNEVYEEWDCPQVLCTADYSAQQPGELSLLIGDVLNVIQKTNDGFLEGRRLVDGERGWFPWGSVKEITNEHVQRRHLRQRYHVLQAANRMLRQRCMSSEGHASTCFR